jgi:hypothetical protein
MIGVAYLKDFQNGKFFLEQFEMKRCHEFG